MGFREKLGVGEEFEFGSLLNAWELCIIVGVEMGDGFRVCEI